MNAEPTITCPTCRTEIKLTESLAAPLIESTRQQYETRIRQQNLDVAKREQAIKDREDQVAKEKEALDAAVAEKLKAEREKLAADASKREQAFKVREEQLLKEKETLDSTVAENLKAERDRIAADVAKREQAFKTREEQLVKEKEAVDAAVADKLKAEREKIATDVAKREQAFNVREEQLAREKETLDAAVADKLKLERGKIAADESKKAKLALGNDLEAKTKELAELNDVLKQRDEKLAEAQKAQAELIRKQRELDDAKREMDLTIEKRVQESLGKTREQAKREATEELSLKVIEKETMIASMARQIEELKKKMEQGSQQLQGEALEIQLELVLSARFPHDRIDPVPRGEHGGDILQRVVTPTGVSCGTILWESKRTRNWSDGWLAKLRDDQRTAKAEIAVIVSAVLPKGVETFDQIDGVWIVHPRAILPMAMSLRHMLVEVNCARQASEGQHTKMELIYCYLTGPKFRLRVQAIVEAFTTMGEDLLKEKKGVQRQWAKREQQIAGVIEATVGMYGELQGIAGKSLQEIEGLEVDHGEVQTLALTVEH